MHQYAIRKTTAESFKHASQELLTFLGHPWKTITFKVCHCQLDGDKIFAPHQHFYRWSMQKKRRNVCQYFHEVRDVWSQSLLVILSYALRNHIFLFSWLLFQCQCVGLELCHTKACCCRAVCGLVLKTVPSGILLGGPLKNALFYNSLQNYSVQTNKTQGISSRRGCLTVTISPSLNHLCIIVSVMPCFSSCLRLWPFGTAINILGSGHQPILRTSSFLV